MIANLIQQLPDWVELNAQEIADLLNAKIIEKIDDQLYTWAGVALIAGAEGAEAFRLALEQNNLGWAVHQLGGSGIQLSNPLVQQVLLGFAQAGLPGAESLALAGKRMVSMMENAGLPEATVEMVEDGLLQIRKKQLEDTATNRLQAYREALSVWDGSGEEPVL
jgi:hypothetical protein